jgi:hypothetical protein
VIGRTGEDGPGGFDGVERVGLAAAAPGLAVGAVDLEDLDPGGLQEPAQPDAVGAGALNPDPGELSEAGQPGVQVLVAGGCGGERLDAQHAAVREGLDEILAGARRRAGLERGTCHELRHTCLTRLREAGMALEAIQAQAGHRSIESTRVYLHLTNDWLAGEYQRAAELIDGTAVAELVAAQEPRR